MKTIEKVINIATGQETVFEREMTDIEIAEFNASKELAEALNKETAAKEAARKAVLEKLGLTADEAAALLG